MPYDPSKDDINDELRRIYSTYIEQIVWRGCTKYEAAMRVGISPEQIDTWIRNAETDPYVTHLLEQETAKLDPEKAWSANTAIVHLIRMLHDANEKGTVKLGAIDRLNVLLGITEIEATGRQTLAQKSLADFYAQRVKRTADSGTTDTPTTH